jgi:hypothetical protein
MLLYHTEGLGNIIALLPPSPPPVQRGQGWNRRGRMKGGRVRGVEAEGAESEGESQRG